MNKYTKQLAEELSSCGKIPSFEIKVVNDNGDSSWISCDIFFRGNSIRVHRDPVSRREQQSSFIASNRLTVDNCLSLDEHMQKLYCAVLDSVISGNLYTINEAQQ